ncbi:FkbM family methyltransferase [Sphingomonas sp. So64.6b]|uniref:FkbM family methyltransferase n=1 Tax=Sphingomonas sp. So64.6b TaxID=2997354 RepID=UPI0016043708|nr:FkbM family methyltransferase [Sphingomonas sp. So64.6b]QNA85139.1 FkbM family methyltransferase [Sphingomonas sp. So64.6b]
MFDRATLRHAPSVAMVNLVPGDIISGYIAFTGEYEPDLSGRISTLARDGGLFVDVGANMGYFSLLWAGARRDNHVIAFEASPGVYTKLIGNVAANGLGDQIETLAKAALDSTGEITFAVGPPDQTGWGGLAPEGGEGVTVPAVRLDDVVGDRTVAVMKVDVEGADLLVLRGCERLLKEKRVNRIFYECNPTRMAELGLAVDDAERYLSEVGYRTSPINSLRTEWMAVPRE